MKVIIFLLSIILHFISFSQNYFEYNKIIIKAQYKIIENDIDSSIFFYNKANNLVSKPFPKDLLNLANSLYYVDSNNICKKTIKKAIKYGAYFKFVKKRFKNKIKDHKFWNECRILYKNTLKEQQNDTLFIFLLNLF